MNQANEKIGEINISDEVVANIVNLATRDIDGVISLYGNVKNGIVEFLGKKGSNKGISIEINEGTVKIDVSIIVEFGIKIPDIAWRIQQNVKRKVEEMTGLKVNNVNVFVRGVNIKNNSENSKNETNN
jgi:uncharacterized alkaline shock family protein YloU